MQYLGFVYNIPPYIKLWKMALLLPGYDPKRMDRAQKLRRRVSHAAGHERDPSSKNPGSAPDKSALAYSSWLDLRGEHRWSSTAILGSR